MFDQNGGLVANAPHIPVHLGAMQEAVKYQIDYARANPLKPGDVLLSNHPACGGHFKGISNHKYNRNLR
jgi:5-oxoprolinase (ATP-hydrolysing)